MIPAEAYKAAEDAHRETLVELRLTEGGGFKVASQNRRALQAALEAAAPYMHAMLLAELRDRDEKLARASDLIGDLTDRDECHFDHHGGCQAHGYLSLDPGETCPQHDAKEWVRAAVAAANGGEG